MAEQKQSEGIDIPFHFRRKPMPIAAELRPDWKVASLLMILQLSSIGGKSSLKRLHVLNWAVRTPQHREAFEAEFQSTLPLFGFNFRFEPAFSRAIDLATGEGFIDWIAGNRVKVTAKGARWISELLSDEKLMSDERQFLGRIGKRVTEKAANNMLSSKGSL